MTRKSSRRRKTRSARNKSSRGSPVRWLLAGSLLVIVGGLGLMAWVRTPTGQSVLLRLGSDKQYDQVQAAVGEALAEALPLYRPGPATLAVDEWTIASHDWPLPVAGPGAAVRCRVLPVPADQTFWEVQTSIAAAVAEVGGQVLWSERWPRPGRQGSALVPDETSDILRLDLGVDQRPTHTLLLYHVEASLPDVGWGVHTQASVWSELQDQGAPTVALVLDDWGYFESEVTAGLLALDVPFTMAILPELPFSRRFALAATELAVPAGAGLTQLGTAGMDRRVQLAQQRTDRGCLVEFYLGRPVRQLPSRRREIILHLPMQPENPQLDPGSGAIRVESTQGEIFTLIEGYLADLPNVSGVNNHMGSLATADRPTMDRVMNVLEPRGLFFLDSLTSSQSVAYQAAQAAGLPALRNRVFLDQAEPSADQVKRSLRQLVRTARSQGFAVGIGHPYAKTLAVLQQEIPRLQQEGVVFVTLSEMLALQRIVATPRDRS